MEKMCRNGTTIRLNETDGVILSPGYALGRRYPVSLNCTWEIEAPAGKVITLDFVVSVE